MKNDNKYLMEQELMEAFTYAEGADIGMPDVDAELLRVRQKAAKRRKKPSGIARIASIAASIAVVFALGWYINSGVSETENLHADDSKSFCVAYVAGERMTDEQQIMDMMSEDIMNMNDGCDIIDTQLNDFFNE